MLKVLPGRLAPWTHVTLVFVFMVVNYADKAVVGLSSVPIMRELGLTNMQLGELGSAFFLLFAVSGVLVGFLANTTRTKVLMLAMALLWAGALLPMTIASSFGVLLASRVLLGAAEGPAFPVALHAVYKWFPDDKRALPTSAVACGAANAAWIVALPSVMQMLLAPGLAGVSQGLRGRGMPSRWSRGVLGALCVTAGGVAMISMAFLPMGFWKVFLLGVSFSIGSVIFTLGSTLIGEITPVPQRGAMLGVTNSVHTLAGLCAPLVMGLLVDVGVDPQSGFRSGFVYAGMLVAAAGAVAALLIDPEGDLRRFRSRDVANPVALASG